MKRMVLVLFAVLAATLPLSATTFTANLKTVTGAVPPNFLRITLKNCAGYIPAVSGDGVKTGKVDAKGQPYWDVYPDKSTGAISITVQDQASIRCGVSTGVAYYNVALMTGAYQATGANDYDITGTSFDLSSATPKAVAPLPAAVLATGPMGPPGPSCAADSAPGHCKVTNLDADTLVVETTVQSPEYCIADSCIQAWPSGSGSGVPLTSVTDGQFLTGFDGATFTKAQVDYGKLLNRPTLAQTLVCADTDKLSAYDAATGLFTCTTDQTGLSGGITSLNGSTQAIQTFSPGANISIVTNTVTGVHTFAVTGLATVATSNSYTDLSNKPTIPAAQVQTDWNASSGMGQLLNKPSTFTPSAHTHTEADVTNLTTDLAAKAAQSALDTTNVAVSARAIISGNPVTGNCTKWVDSTHIGDAGEACGSGSGGSSAGVTFNYPGVPGSTAVIASVIAPYDFTIPINCVGSSFASSPAVAATAQTIFTVSVISCGTSPCSQPNPGGTSTQVGTATFAASGTVATFSCLSSVTIHQYDIVQIAGGGDNTLGNLTGVIYGTR